MPVSNEDAWDLLLQGYEVIVTCESCGDTLWAGDAEWLGIKPYHPECEEELAKETLQEMWDEFSEDG